MQFSSFLILLLLKNSKKTNKILWKSKICSSQLLSNTFSSGGSFGSSCMQSFRLEPVKFASTDIFSEHLSRISGTISSSTHFPNINLCHLGTRSETWLRTISVGDVWASEERSIIIMKIVFILLSTRFVNSGSFNHSLSLSKIWLVGGGWYKAGL